MNNEKRRIGIFGGSFNPPHNGHIAVAESAIKRLKLDTLLVIPTGIPPHKNLAKGSPSSVDRYKMTELAFSEMGNVEVLDIELRRSGRSYTADTLKEIIRSYPRSDIFLIMGADMFLTIQDWYKPEDIFANCTVCALCRESGQSKKLLDHKDYLAKRFGADCLILDNEEVVVSSTEVRKAIREKGNTDLIPSKVMEYIRANKFYISNKCIGSKNSDLNTNFCQNDMGEIGQSKQSNIYHRAMSFIDPERRPHVDGCINEAISLSNHWGEDSSRAATAALLHDVTKSLSREEQLKLCEKYGIIPRTADIAAFGPLHAITGAAVARDEFGADSAIESAIRYHTTGRAKMTRLEIIIYLADYIEPTRNFPGVHQVRDLAYDNLELAMLTALRNTIEEICSKGKPISPDTIEAYNYFLMKSSDSR
ncbi:MAG: nicotinate (nicotinamide) nucleotide adenylyltransferase [Eubacteriales bacterium]|jgi:nicotinate-nucleotide adenylyltransferase